MYNGDLYKIVMNGDLYMKRTALVFGAGGFIGSHMVKRLRSEGYWVRGVDLKQPEYAPTQANEFITGDLTSADLVRRCIEFKGEAGNFYILFLINILILLMRSISMLLIWVVLDISLVVRMIRR